MAAVSHEFGVKAATGSAFDELKLPFAESFNVIYSAASFPNVIV